MNCPCRGFLSETVREVGVVARAPLDESGLMTLAMQLPPARGFVGAWSATSIAVVAEVKRASPSVGPIAEK